MEEFNNNPQYGSRAWYSSIDSLITSAHSVKCQNWTDASMLRFIRDLKLCLNDAEDLLYRNASPDEASENYIHEDLPF